MLSPAFLQLRGGRSLFPIQRRPSCSIPSEVRSLRTRRRIARPVAGPVDARTCGRRGGRPAGRRWLARRTLILPSNKDLVMRSGRVIGEKCRLCPAGIEVGIFVVGGPRCCALWPDVTPQGRRQTGAAASRSRDAALSRYRRAWLADKAEARRRKRQPKAAQPFPCLPYASSYI